MQWKNEIETHTSGFKVYMFHGGSREKSTKELIKYDVVLTTYAVLESSFRKQVSGFKRKDEIIKEKSPLHAVHWRRIIVSSLFIPVHLEQRTDFGVVSWMRLITLRSARRIQRKERLN